MSKAEQKKDGVPAANSMAAFSEKLNDLKEALGILYISKNPSGRNRFREKWPEVAQYLYGTDLINYDINGVEDKKHREKLEDDANDRRIALKATMAEIVNQSVDAGSLKFDYVGSVIDQYGASMSTYLYAEDVIERVRPGVLAAEKNEKSADAPIEKPAEDKSGAPDDLSDTSSVDEVSEDLQVDIEAQDDIADTAILGEEKDMNKADNQTGIVDPALLDSDAKLSDAEKTLLSNHNDIDDNIKPIDTTAPPEEEAVPEISSVVEKMQQPAAPASPPSEPEQPPSEKTQLPPASQESKIRSLAEAPPSAAKPSTAPPPVPEAADNVKPIETPLPPPVVPAPDVQETQDAAVMPPEVPTAAPPIPETPAPAVQPPQDQVATTPQPDPVADMPDILKTPAPPPAEMPQEEGVQEPAKIEELTLPQASKAAKGVYKTMFNALAKAA